MATLDRMAIIKALQIAGIEDILMTKLDFLSKLYSRELRILAVALEELLGCHENHIGIDSISFH